ncbi:hypothetical protein NEDG_00228 [Nematocida displodere]|uniref:Uncharacterized protein n=1 Tax=Nematocida displodere TaxID=1805483 RepID=A0A177EIF8_9MICR|nr:hypothetical protein NEDG_00228 [Nematocida displodere]
MAYALAERAATYKEALVREVVGAVKNGKDVSLPEISRIVPIYLLDPELTLQTYHKHFQEVLFTYLVSIKACQSTEAHKDFVAESEALYILLSPKSSSLYPAPPNLLHLQELLSHPNPNPSPLPGK